MYNPMFITELFRPQDVYTMHSTRQIFDRLAHSSIMRLNESSMDKVGAARRPSRGALAAAARTPRSHLPTTLTAVRSNWISR